MSEPPVSAGAAQDTSIWPWPAVSVGMPGLPGTPTGVADAAGDQAPLPRLLIACTCTEYGVPLVRPVIV